MKPDKQLVDILQKADAAFKKSSVRPDEWPEWCASYLIGSSNFNHLTQRQWEKRELAEALRALRATYERRKPKHSRAHFFALRLSN